MRPVPLTHPFSPRLSNIVFHTFFHIVSHLHRHSFPSPSQAHWLSLFFRFILIIVACHYIQWPQIPSRTPMRLVQIHSLMS